MYQSDINKSKFQFKKKLAINMTFSLMILQLDIYKYIYVKHYISNILFNYFWYILWFCGKQIEACMYMFMCEKNFYVWHLFLKLLSVPAYVSLIKKKKYIKKFFFKFKKIQIIMHNPLSFLFTLLHVSSICISNWCAIRILRSHRTRFIRV